MLQSEFGGVFVANDGLDAATANELVASGQADAVSFGKLFIANPDLPARLAAGAALSDWRAELFYTPGPEGYVDYPTMSGGV